MAKVVIVSQYAPSLVNFRGELIREIVSRGHQVICLGPEKGFEKEMARLGATYTDIPLERTGMNPLHDVSAVYAIARLLRQSGPDSVLSYAIKPVIYGSLAARLAGVKGIFSMITGLGYLFTGDGLKQRLVSRLIRPLYRSALRSNRAIFFQNPDDSEFFRQLRLALPEQQVMINGSGVDLSHFAYSPAPSEPLAFLLMARLIWDKGIREFVQAARRLKNRYPQLVFRLLGPFDTNPEAIRPDEVEAWVSEGTIEYLGEAKDVRRHLTNASVFVLPSFYREGTPRSVLEAMSTGRPIITTDSPGCRETVKNGVNGFLIPVKNSGALERAMEQFVLQPGLLDAYGKASRRMAEDKYDVRKVNKVILQTMGLD